MPVMGLTAILSRCVVCSGFVGVVGLVSISASLLMGQARIGDEVACQAFLHASLWFGDGRGSSAFNIHIHMLGEGEIDNDDFTCFDKETVRYICR